jgi:general secretion pathway protein B
MSIILDALRKSEHQRQRNATPGLADHAIKPASSKPTPWLIIVSALLLLNILLVILWLNAGSPPTDTQPSPSTQVRPAPNRDNTRQATSPVSPATPKAAPEPAPIVATPPPVVSAPPPTPPAPAVALSTEGLPSIETLQLQGLISLPPLRVDLHVYSNISAERFVFINMKKQTEGSALAEGPTVQQITPDGVVLSWQGQRFVLSKN